jgi:hypothetical protein
MIGSLLFAGCSTTYHLDERPVVSYETFEADCFDVLAREPLVLEESIGPVSEGCAQTVGDVLNIDWHSFDDQPRGFDRDDTAAQLLISGFVVLAGGAGLTAEDVFTEGMPEGLRERMASLDDRSAGHLWFELLHSTVRHTVYDPKYDAMMGFRDGWVFVGDITQEASVFQQHIEIPMIAQALVHEASHDVYDSHELCGEEDCDLDREGAYGAGAWWSYRILDRHAGDMDPAQCREIYDNLLDTCGRLAEPGDYPACLFADLEHSCSD